MIFYGLQVKSKMLNCEICYQHNYLLFTKCCKSIICSTCSERQDRKINCLCGRPLPQGVKNYTEHPELLTLLKRFQEGKNKECDRCDRQCDVECLECQMLYCQTCNSQVHAALGFAKHTRKRVADASHSFEKARVKELNCLQHSQAISAGCECGAPLCSLCLKPHKESCPRYKLKSLREFKQEYFINVLLKMRQLTFYKERLSEDKSKYQQHFKTQSDVFRQSEELISEQFGYLKKMVEIKEKEVRTKINLYWEQCQRVYANTLDRIEKQVRKYQQYAELLQTFSQNLTSLDYFDKKIRKFQVPLEFVTLKSLNFQQAQTNIMAIGLQEKPWELVTPDPLTTEPLKEAAPVTREDLKIMTTMQNTSQLILDYSHNPLRDRQLTLLSSHSEIFFNFIHLPYQSVKYEVEYGVGMRMKGQEIFKRVLNNNGYGVIEGLNPNTKYRVRMRVAEGSWGSITEVTTLDIPKFNIASSSFAKSMAQNTVQLGKGGIIYGSNEINFGIHRWVIKVTSKTISYQDSETACLSVGVSNKEAKKAVFAGTTLNYGFQKSEIVLKILLDLNEKRLSIVNCTTNKEQVYQNLPNFPLFPTIQNKGNGQIMVRYNLTTDDAGSC